MAAPRETLASTQARSAKWISGGILVASLLVTILYGDVSPMYRAYFLISLSTTAVIQGLSLNNLVKSDEIDQSFQKNMKIIWLTIFAMIFHTTAFIFGPPISYFALLMEILFFALACRGILTVNIYK